jgi:hypothetical protein
MVSDLLACFCLLECFCEKLDYLGLTICVSLLEVGLMLLSVLSEYLD